MFQNDQIKYDRFTLNSRILLLIVIFYGAWFSIPSIFHFGIQIDIIYLQFSSFILPAIVAGLLVLMGYARLARHVPIYWWIIMLSLVLGVGLSWYSYNRLYEIVEKI